MSRDRMKVPIEDGDEVMQGVEEVEGATSEGDVFEVDDPAEGELAGEGDVEEEVETQAPPDFHALHIGRLEDQIADLKRKLEKTYAAARNRDQELDRIKERLERDRVKRLFLEKAKLFEKLLDPLDNLDRSVAAAQTSGDLKSLLDGLRMVHRQFHDVVVGMGLEKFEPEGQPFDPEFHEAISIVPVRSKAKHDIIFQVFQPGYILLDQVIRPARVVVGKYQG